MGESVGTGLDCGFCGNGWDSRVSRLGRSGVDTSAGAGWGV